MPGKVISPRYFHFHPSVAGTTGARVFASAQLDVGINVLIDEIRVVIPNGHAGLTGVQIAYSSTIVVPWSSTLGYLVGNQSDWAFDMGDLEVSAPLVVNMFNDDALTHGWDVQVKVRDIDLARLTPAVGGTAVVI